MDKKVRSITWLESRGLLWFTVLAVAVVFMVQYMGLPHKNVFPSLFALSKIPIVRENGAQKGNLSYKSGMENNRIPLNDPSCSNASAVDENYNSTHTFYGNTSQRLTDSDEISKDEAKISDISLSGKYVDQSINLNGNSIDNSSLDFPPDERRVSKGGQAEENGAPYKDSTQVIVENEKDTTSSKIVDNILVEMQENSSIHIVPLTENDTNTRNQVESVNPLLSSAENGATKNFGNEDKSPVRSDLDPVRNSTISNVPKEKQRRQPLEPSVISISEMNKMLIRNRNSLHSVVPRWSAASDKELLYAKARIEAAPIIRNDPSLYGPLYRNVSIFKRSYEVMEEMLKVYIYKEGEKPIFHQSGPVLKGIYASEGWFMKQLESNKKFVTKNPRKAHLFYLPFSSRILEEKLYVPNSHSHKNLIRYLENYVDTIAAKYPFWNRTDGADHFLVACHDWAPSETRGRMGNCIRALCNSDAKDGFIFGKDVALPETYVRLTKNPLRDLGGKPTSKRPILAFFAGSMHGYLRPILLQHWENKDPDMKIFGRLPSGKGKMNYIRYMQSSKYCICAKGYEVNSPRIVEAIFFECVPVIISDNYVPPFFEVLNWESFAIFVLEKDIPNLKNILLSVPERRYREMQMRVKKVQQHFLWHARPVKYDIFHMILHSIWFNRIFRA